MDKLEVNYHSHTSRCGHAFGNDEDFVLAAIKTGFKIYGFSDHVMLPGLSQPGIRGDFSLAADYFLSVKSLKEKYKDKILIHVGYEAEWYGTTFKRYYRDLLRSHTVDYLLLGQHCFLKERELVFYGRLEDKKEALNKYAADLIEGIESGLFSAICHPDLYRSFYPYEDDDSRAVARRIVEAAVKADIPLEVNMGPSRWGRKESQDGSINVAYPSDELFSIASELGAKCIIGVDDHMPSDLVISPYDWIDSFVNKHHLRMVKVLPLDE